MRTSAYRGANGLDRMIVNLRLMPAQYVVQPSIYREPFYGKTEDLCSILLTETSLCNYDRHNETTLFLCCQTSVGSDHSSRRQLRLRCNWGSTR